MKRGFLLPPPKKSRQSTKACPSLPQCKVSDGDALKPQRRRVVTTSSDLLQLETAERDSSELFQVLHAGNYSDGSDEHDCVSTTIDEFPSTFPIDDSCHNSLLDDWVLSSSSRPIVVPSSSANKPLPSRQESAVKSTRTLIVEVANSTGPNQGKNGDPAGELASNAADGAHFELNRGSPCKVAWNDSERSEHIEERCKCQVIDDSPNRDTHEPQLQHQFHEKDRLLLANDLSLLLSRLRRCTKYNDKRRIQHRTVGFEGVFDGMYMSQEAEIQVKEFVAKHFLTVHPGAEPTTSTRVEQGTPSETALTIHSKLTELWSNILGPIAQDYSAKSSSPSLKTKNNRSTSSWISPSLAVGLGILAYSNDTALVYDCLESTLLAAAKLIRTSWKVTEKDNDATEKIEQIENKQKKIFALGAIYLLRCWIRSLGVKLSQWEVKLESTLDDDESTQKDGMTGVSDFYSKIEISLLKILSALEMIVSSDTRRTVLALAAMDACFELVEISARTTVLLQICQGSATPSTPVASDFELQEISECLYLWKDILPIIDKLLIVKQGWISAEHNCAKIDIRENRDDHDLWVSRSTCLKVVLDDWKAVSKTSKRHFFDYIAGKERCLDKVQLHDGADLAAGLTLIWNLAGIKVHRTRTHEDNSCTSRVGGIAQSLCQNQECTIGYAAGSFYDCGGDADVADLVLPLQEAIHRTSPSSASWIVKVHQRLVIRALVSWLSKSKRNSRGLLKTSKDHPQLIEKMTGVILRCLCLESNPCVNMSLAALSMVWNLSPIWQPRETKDDDSQSCLRYFLELLDALRVHSAESATEEKSDQNIKAQLDSTTAGLCVIISKVASRNPEHLLPRVLEFSGPKEAMLEVVINMLEQLPTNTFVQKSAIQVFLGSVDDMPYSRVKIQLSQACFYQIPCNLIVPAILDYLTKKYSEKSSSSGVATVSILLRNVMISKANEDQSNEFVKCALGFFGRDDTPGATTRQTKTGVVTTFIEKNVSLWRSALLDETLSPDSAYGNMIMAASRAIIESPSSSTPLSLFSSLVKIKEDFPQTPDTKKKILTATCRILDFVTNKMSESRSENQSISDTNIFTSIAPLLILRCIPSSFYRTIHEVLHAERNIKTVMVELSRLLVESIKRQAMKNEKSDLAREERRLVAEVAGHCLPLSNQSSEELVVDGEKSPSLFDNICKDSFSAVLQNLRKTSPLSKENMICRIVESKSALYAVCHHLPIADDNDEGTALLNVACFAMEVLQYNLATANNSKENDVELLLEEIAMLQSGCVNFLAVVFDSLSLRKTRNRVSFTQHTMVEEVDFSVRFDEPNDQRRCSILDSLSMIFHHVKKIIISGKSDRFCFSAAEEFYEGGMPTKHHRYSPSSRTAILNSLVVLSRTSIGQDGKMEWIAQNVLPVLVEWAHPGPIDDSVHHPLCVAAGLQVVYTILARVGSFDWILSPGSTTRAKDCAETDFACLVLNCALSSFEAVERNDSPILSTLRLAALKLILTVMAIQKTFDSNLVNYLKPLEVQKAIKAVTFAANFDKDPDVRRLASEVVPRLHHASV
eukprot:CCRYP_013314-RA/>CCRYP_013314-RA protein AED:0.08 eAED:0.08 QI:95/1/1/1/0.33/0.25/4/3020/1551